MQGRHLLQRRRAGLSLRSQIARRLGGSAAPRFAGVRLSAPDAASAWGIAYQISTGEYAFAGLEPEAGDHVIDIGANVGVFALWATRRGASVTAYEPAPATFEHLAMNTKAKPVGIVQAAVVGQPPDEGTVRLYLHDERSTRNTLVGHEIESSERLHRYVDVMAMAIDDVLHDGCDLLKVDCEGGEFDIFEHAGEDALAKVRRVILEFHRTAGDPETLLAKLRSGGFKARILSGENQDASLGVIGAWRV